MRLVILGAGGHGCTVASVAKLIGKYEEIFFLDDHYIDNECKELFYGPAKVSCKLRGKCCEYTEFIDKSTEFYPAFGDNHIRIKWQNEIISQNGELATIIHPSSIVDKDSIIKQGTVVLQNAVINVGCIIEKGCIINIGAIIDHGCHINEGVHVNSGAIVMAENNIPQYTLVNSGEIVKWRSMAF
jgi:hypothetical protein